MKHKKNNNSKNKTRKRLKKLASPRFSLAAPKNRGSKIWSGPAEPPFPPPPPHRTPGQYIPRKEIKKDKLFFKQLRSSYLLG